MKDLTRREFIQKTGVGLGLLSFSQVPSFAHASSRDDDHFYVHFFIEGGWDPTYMFDGRPLQMTKDKLVHNYLGKEPVPFVGANGNKTLMSECAKPLLKQKDAFSVVNGVHMYTSAVGHPDNVNFHFTGNPFGGDSYLPSITTGKGLTETSITGIHEGLPFFLNASNHGSIIGLSGQAGQDLMKQIKSNPIIDTSKDIFRFIRYRFVENSKGKGKFSKTNQKLVSTFDKQYDLAQKIAGIQFGNGSSTDPKKDSIELVANLFKRKMARMAFFDIRPDFNLGNFIAIDSHAYESALLQPDMYKELSQRLSDYIELMRTTPYDSNRSLLDVTTFVISSEFSRTFRSPFSQSFEETGTEHNPFSNSFLIGGKGVRCGQVIGQSDFHSSNEKLSKAHLDMDPDRYSPFGRPFDFKTQKLSGQLPEKFETSDYISMPNITNTILDIFGAKKDTHWEIGNLGQKAPILTSLIK